MSLAHKWCDRNVFIIIIIIVIIIIIIIIKKKIADVLTPVAMHCGEI